MRCRDEASGARGTGQTSAAGLRLLLSGALTILGVAVSAAAARADSFDVLAPASRDADLLATLSWWLFAVGTIVFVLTLAALMIAIFRRGSPLSSRSAWALVIAGGIAAPAVAGIGVTLSGLAIGRATETGPGAPDLVVEVEGKRWWWEIRYLDVEGRLIATTANELHLPVGRRAEIVLTSDNVIHSFWVPNLQGKTDLIPGTVNRTWLEPSEPGLFRGQCAEFCGIQHALMAFHVVAEPPAEFDRWLAAQAAPAPDPGDPLLERGREVFLGVGCGGCHAIRGTAAAGETGPDLTHLASRVSLAAGTLPNTLGHLGGWVTDPQNVKPGALMPALEIPADGLRPMLAYLQSLE